jgi:tripartite ATP-independent transporter DctM subunit
MTLLLVCFFVLLIIGVPIAVSMALSAVIVFLTTTNMPILLTAQRMQYAVDSFSQLAIPFFILAGHFMNAGGISKRIVDFASSLVGHIKGGLAQVMVVASMLFAGISGSAYADASMLGTLLLPTMKERKYPIPESTVILAAGSTIGPIIPPSIQMVIFGVTASVSVGRLLLGGLLPGILMGLSLMAIAYVHAARGKWPYDTKASWKERWRTFREAFWALLMPVLVVGGILTGFFTPTEAAVVASLYAFIVGRFVFKKLQFKDILPICVKVFKQTAQVTIIIACAGVLGWLLTKEQIPAKLSTALLSITNSKVIILLLINLILLILGCFMETTAVVLLMTPVFMPIVTAINVDPVHFGVFMILNLCIGLITPPVGMCMYIACGISKCTIGDFVKKLPPYLMALLVALFITVFFEPIVTFLPNLLMGP